MVHFCWFYSDCLEHSNNILFIRWLAASCTISRLLFYVKLLKISYFYIISNGKSFENWLSLVILALNIFSTAFFCFTKLRNPLGTILLNLAILRVLLWRWKNLIIDCLIRGFMVVSIEFVSFQKEFLWYIFSNSSLVVKW